MVIAIRNLVVTKQILKLSKNNPALCEEPAAKILATSEENTCAKFVKVEIQIISFPGTFVEKLS